MKSQVNDILHVLRGLLNDVQAAYPTVKGIDRDFDRLSRTCQTRGLGVLSLDLPVLSDLLRDGLRTGRLPQEAQPFGWVSKRNRVPRLFSGLWMRVFDRQSCLRSDADVDAVAFIDQLSSIAKKVRHECSSKRKFLALKGYVNVESEVRSPSLSWQGDKLSNSEADIQNLHLVETAVNHLPLFEDENPKRGRALFLLAKCQQIADMIVSRMLPFDPEIWSDLLQEYEGITGLRHGTGAVSQKGVRENKSHFLSWPTKLEAVFPYHRFGGELDSSNPIDRKETHSQLHMVPKTLKGPRIIAAEPVEHQWCQGLILNFMVFEFSRLFSGSFIDLKDQGKSNALVLQASLDGSLATIDLSDASDRLSCFVVERIFRKNIPLLRAFHAARTRYVKVNPERNEFLSFKKFASQGTGVTFPVQSLVFLCAALAASHRGNVITWKSIMALKRSVRVYGDDIIIPTHGYEDARLLLETMGLKVNERKSFASGQFRESCGVNGFKGYDVTPIKPQVFRPNGPGDIIALVDESNNLFKKGYWHASAALLSRLPNYALRRFRISGPDITGTPGIFSFSGFSEAHLRRRWNHDLQRTEVLVFAYSARRGRVRRDGYARIVDLSTMAYNPWNPRVVSEFERIRYAKGGVRWEPATSIM